MVRRPTPEEYLTGVWESARANMATYLMLADKSRAFRSDPRVVEAMAYAGVPELATPTLGEGESLADFLASDDKFDVQKAAERDYGFVALQQLAVEHLAG